MKDIQSLKGISQILGKRWVWNKVSLALLESFVDEVKDIYSAEKHLLKVPQDAKSSHHGRIIKV